MFKSSRKPSRWLSSWTQLRSAPLCPREDFVRNIFFKKISRPCLSVAPSSQHLPAFKSSRKPSSWLSSWTQLRSAPLCPREDLNLHENNSHYPLKVARLPVSPLEHSSYYRKKTNKLKVGLADKPTQLFLIFN